MIIKTLIMIMLLVINSSAVCIKSPKGFYNHSEDQEFGYGTYVKGMPTPNNVYIYIQKPQNLTCFHLKQMHKLCISRINMYRKGLLPFSNGKYDITVNPLIHANKMDRCHSEITLGDFSLMKSGICSKGAHKNAWNCIGFNDAWGQNECCPLSVDSKDFYGSSIKKLYACLQAMWDQGMQGFNGTKIYHWLNMRSSDYNYGSCGFAYGYITNNVAGIITKQYNNDSKLWKNINLIIFYP